MCGTVSKLSSEHVLPNWLLDVIGPLDGAIGHRYEGPPGSGILREWRAYRPDVKVKNVCKPCNTGWMSRLETAVLPIMTPLIKGRSRVLPLIETTLLTRWFLKTIFMLELAGERTQRITPPTLERWVRDNVLPDVGITLWVGAAQQPSGITTAGRSAQTQLGSEPPRDAWMFAIVLGHLILAALGTCSSARPPQLSPPLVNALSQVWPAPPVLQYPPPIQLSQQHVPLILHMLAASLS